MISILTEARKGVLTKFGGDLEAIGKQLGPSIAGALGPAIRQRVQHRADTAGQPSKAWDASYKNFLVSPRYPGVGGKGREHRSGARAFDDSQAFHAAMGARQGAYSVSGGMWEGLTRIVITPTLVELRFRGRSESQSPNIRGGRRQLINYTIHQGGMARAVARRAKVGTARGLRINNALKASTVLSQHGVNVLALSTVELEAISIGAVSSLAQGVGNMLDVEWSGGVIRGATVEEVMRRMLGGGPTIGTGV